MSEEDGEVAAIKRRWSTESTDSARTVKSPKVMRRPSTFEAEGILEIFREGSGGVGLK